MRNSLLFIFISVLLVSCSHKNQLTYLSNSKYNSIEKSDVFLNNLIGIGDILKIDIHTDIPEASYPYNKSNNNLINSMNLLLVNGYLVDKNSNINFPILGEINVFGNTETQLSEKIAELLVKGGHLKKPHVKVKVINSKFTVLGEVRNPGTFTFYDKKLNIFQALGYAGDLLITAKRVNVKLIRDENGLRKTYVFSLKNNSIFNKPYFLIKNNDVIIIEPNFSKIKSAGFIGSPASIASISSLVLSITLLIINNYK